MKRFYVDRRVFICITIVVNLLLMLFTVSCSETDKETVNLIPKQEKEDEPVITAGKADGLEEINQEIITENMLTDSYKPGEKSEVIPILLGSRIFGVIRFGEYIGGGYLGGWEECIPYLSFKQRYRTYSKGKFLGYGRIRGVVNSGHGYRVGMTWEESEGPESDEYIAIAAEYNALPRIYRELEAPFEEELDAVNSFLKSKGISNNVPLEIINAFEVDLEGDGIQEKIIAASNFKSKDKYGGTDEFLHGLIIVEKILDGKTVIIPVEHNTIKSNPDSNSYDPERVYITDIIDLNGDGVLEILTMVVYYESTCVSVFEIRGNTASCVLSIEEGA